jgi:D-alanyl-D-alanine carboxypeptidase (penicillin-binding protein 5/6)
MMTFALPVSALGTGDLYSATAVLLDGESGQVLFDKGKDAQVYPASTTKIMTAILVLESCALDEVVTVSRSALDIDEWDSASINLIVGEELTVDDALYALMLPSANDMANALAEHVAGTQEDFALMMTEKARELGAVNTNFTNAHGLPDDNHYTTAYDMALITKYAMQNSDFMRYFSADAHIISATNLQPIPRELRNYQEMLLAGSAFYDPSVTGGKVGYTGDAGHTMSTTAEKYGRSLICVVMRSGRDEKFYDTAALLQHGFNDFQPASLPASAFRRGDIPVYVGGRQTGTAEFYSESGFDFLLGNGQTLGDVRVDYRLPASVGRGTPPDASADVYLGDELLGTRALSYRVVRDDDGVPSWLANPREQRDEPNRALPVVLFVASAGLVILWGVLRVRGGKGKRQSQGRENTRP